MVNHPVGFHGLTFDADTGKPLPTVQGRACLIERTDEDFISGFLEELQTAEGRKILASKVTNAGETEQGLKLLQPVHRSFHLAVFQVVCDVFGWPRLDPTKIDSSGLVVRRINPDTGRLEGWMRKDGEPIGWRDLRDSQWEPDPTRRKKVTAAGQPALDQKLRRLVGVDESMEETVSPAFIAPPNVCTATERTIVYGLVPVTSSERSARHEAVSLESTEIRSLLAPWFSPEVTTQIHKFANWAYSSKGVERQLPEDVAGFVAFLRVLHSVFDAFADDKFLAILDRIELEFADAPAKRKAGQELKKAANVFLFNEDGAEFRFPKYWPQLSKIMVAEIEQAAAAAYQKRLASILPWQGRFEDARAKYEVWGFVRVKRDDGCPPKIHWATPSQAFAIASWFENGKLPPVPIALPAITKANVKKLLPNAAFQVPAGLSNFLATNDPKKILDGEAKEGSSSGLEWICSFNIPIITLCAFIVLNMILSLLNIVFWWMAFIKICIPIPASVAKKLKAQWP